MEVVQVKMQHQTRWLMGDDCCSGATSLCPPCQVAQGREAGALEGRGVGEVLCGKIRLVGAAAKVRGREPVSCSGQRLLSRGLAAASDSRGDGGLTGLIAMADSCQELEEA
eukprot:766685-Hanusia_phi.AAC.3